jgi:signal transduction histidine kinase
LDTINSVAARMATQVDELLDAAALRTGQPLALKPQATDLVAVARHAAATYQQTTDRHHIDVATDEDEVVGLWDGPRLERVLGNLLSNAVKYSPGGGAICVGIATEQADGAGWAVLSVQDHGVGIPTGDLPRLFEPFHRSANVVGRIAGTGIGLAAVYQIVTQHGGTVSAESEEGKGSTFTVRLPLLPPGDA